MSGPWLARAISAANPGLLAPLVMWADNVFTTLEYRNQCRAFRHNGGHHIIDKTWHPAAQLHTLDAALDGETWQPPSDGLTFAERQIIAYYVDGHDAQAIAIALNRSRATIEGHITSVRQKLLPFPLPPGTARGAGPVLAAVASADSCVSWVPVQYLREPSGVFAEIGKPEVSDGIDAASRDFTPIGEFESDRRRRHASSNATNRSDLHESDDVNDTAGVRRTGTATTTTHAGPLAFLCHASEDKPYVRRLKARLRSDGIRTWLDERDLMPGQEWERAIRAAVRQADASSCAYRVALSRSVAMCRRRFARCSMRQTSNRSRAPTSFQPGSSLVISQSDSAGGRRSTCADAEAIHVFSTPCARPKAAADSGDATRSDVPGMPLARFSSRSAQTRHRAGYRNGRDGEVCQDRRECPVARWLLRKLPGRCGRLDGCGWSGSFSDGCASWQLIPDRPLSWL